MRVKGPKAVRKHVRVVVKGPRQPGARKKFKRTIKKTTTWPRVRPGVYRIKVRKVSFHNQVLETSVTKKRVRIRRNRARKATKVKILRPRYCLRAGGHGSRLLAWGDNQHGQLGSRGGGVASTPQVNRWLRGADQVTGTAASVVARCQDGTVWTWGDNSYGQLGFGGSQGKVWPVRVKRVTGALEVAAGSRTAYARDADGTVWAWGSGRYGELGNGSSGPGIMQRRPVRVALPAPAVAIAAGGHTAYAVLDDGRVAAWGNGGVGQRGDGTLGESTPTPVIVTGLSDVVAIAAGRSTAYALSSSSLLHAWGDANQGQIAGYDGSSSSAPVPVRWNVHRIGASQAAGYYATTTGDIHGWGSGRHHDVGFDNGGNPAAPGPIEPLHSSGHQVAAFAGKGYTGYVLTVTRHVWSWGSNSRGQAGTGAPLTGPASTSGVLPAQVAGLSGIVAIGAGDLNGYAIR